jgi:predicted DCC family thiol-disulfide oxidoreductase YuxK
VIRPGDVSASSERTPEGTGRWGDSSGGKVWISEPTRSRLEDAPFYQSDLHTTARILAGSCLTRSCSRQGGPRLRSGANILVARQWKRRFGAGGTMTACSRCASRPAAPQTLPSGNGDHVESPRPVLLYDGTCGFCAESVQLVLRHDRQGTLQFAALDSTFGRAVLVRHPELALVDSVVWYEPAHGGTSERLLTRSAAALRVARYLGGAWRLATVAGLMPRVFRDSLYNLVARHRHQMVRGGQQCLVPSPDQRARFLP